jgi:hypothetical protein
MLNLLVYIESLIWERVLRKTSPYAPVFEESNVHSSSEGNRSNYRIDSFFVPNKGTTTYPSNENSLSTGVQYS